MVASYPESVGHAVNGSRFIYITGCDGTGKTTQAELLLSYLEAMGRQPQHLWLRFPFFLTLPLLAYARWRGYSWYEETDGVRHGYWDFRNSWLLRKLLPWLLLADASLAALVKVDLPLMRGRTLVCERFVLDMLVDLAVAFNDPDFHLRMPGRLFLRLLPGRAMIIILDVDVETIRQRRADLRVDRRLSARLGAFRCLARDRSLPVLSSTIPAAELNRHIQAMIEHSDECGKEK